MKALGKGIRRPTKTKKTYTLKPFPSGFNPCCEEAKEIVKGSRHCVCSFRSYCPTHGVRCNGTHD